MSEQEPLNLEEAQKEAHEMREKIESGEAKDYDEAEKLVDSERIKKQIEQELSPEVVEKVMEKVQDINTKGIAYSRVSYAGSEESAQKEFYEILKQKKFTREEDVLEFYKREEETIREIKDKTLISAKSNLKKMFKVGIQGGLDRDSGIPGKKPIENSKDWQTKLKSGKENFVFFNIVGRGLPPSSEKKRKSEIGNTNYMSSDAIAILFDLSGYKEIEPSSGDYDNKKNLTYRTNSPTFTKVFDELKEKYPDLKLGDDRLKNYFPYGKNGEGFDDQGLPLVETEYGFRLSPRVPPRRFSGIVFEMEKLDHSLASEDELSRRSEEIVSVMNESTKKNSLLPIYDTNGNLLWPKKMSYEEVRKFVAEREPKK
jgi:hypothetical protein